MLILSLSLSLRSGCSWTKNWLVFDNSYYQRALEGTVANRLANKDLLWLPTDQALVEDAEWLHYYKIYAEDKEAFFRDYRAAHIKMSELGAKFILGTKGDVDNFVRIPTEVIESTKASNVVYTHVPPAPPVAAAPTIDATSTGPASSKPAQPTATPSVRSARERVSINTGSNASPVNGSSNNVSTSNAGVSSRIGMSVGSSSNNKSQSEGAGLSTPMVDSSQNSRRRVGGSKTTM